MRRLTLKQLMTIRAVAQAGTIAMAAETLNVTAAALTSRIKHLEEDAQTLLFDRIGGRLRLTDAGQEVVNAATRINLVLNDLDNTLTAIRDKKAGRVTVGVVSTAKYFAPRLIAAFSKQNPRIEVSISVGNRSEIIESLRDYSIDLAMMGRPLLDFDVSSEYFGQHPQVVIGAPDHPLASRKAIDKAELSSESFIVREPGSGTRGIFDYFLGGIVVRQPRIGIEIGSNETIKQAVMAGLGLALISAHTIEAEVAAGRLVVLDVVGLPIMREWFVVHRADHQLSPIGQAMWDFTVQEGKTFLPKVV
jgi:LysR family transcriptional regulator, low CO2-responsive transcriptional regulator